MTNDKNGADNAYYSNDVNALAAVFCGHIQTIHQVINNTAKSGGLDGWMLLIMNSIHFGRLENQPMDISSIIEATGISRAAVYRRLKALEGRGYIRILHDKNRRIPCLTDECDFDPTSFFAEIMKLITHSAWRAKKVTPCPICFRFQDKAAAAKDDRGESTSSSTIGEEPEHD